MIDKNYELIKEKIVTRECICCEGYFRSPSKFVRICDRCKKNDGENAELRRK